MLLRLDLHSLPDLDLKGTPCSEGEIAHSQCRAVAEALDSLPALQGDASSPSCWATEFRVGGLEFMVFWSGPCVSLQWSVLHCRQLEGPIIPLN